MGRKTQIAVIVVAVLVVLGVGAAYAYDSSQKDKIADGVTIAGVDVGGLNRRRSRQAGPAPAAGAAAPFAAGQLRGRELGAARWQAEDPRRGRQGGRRSGGDSQDGGFPGRLVRYVTGEEVAEQISPQVTYSKSARQQIRPPGRRGNQSRTAERGRRTERRLAQRRRRQERTQAARQQADRGSQRRGPQRHRPAHDRRQRPLDQS